MASENGKVIISLSDIEMSRNERLILHNVNLNVDNGDFIAITGPNGGGKTTLLKIILKLVKPTNGNVQYFDEFGNEVDKLNIGYLPQKNAIDSHFPITVKDVVYSGLLAKKRDADTPDKVNEMISLVGLENDIEKSIGNLSGGQLQRALLGRALISNPDILVLDEPLSYLDKHFEHRVYEIIESIAKRTTILLVSHEMSVIASMANRHIIVDGTLHPCAGHFHYIPSDCC